MNFIRSISSNKVSWKSGREKMGHCGWYIGETWRHLCRHRASPGINQHEDIWVQTRAQSPAGGPGEEKDTVQRFSLLMPRFLRIHLIDEVKFNRRIARTLKSWLSHYKSFFIPFPYRWSPAAHCLSTGPRRWEAVINALWCEHNWECNVLKRHLVRINLGKSSLQNNN